MPPTLPRPDQGFDEKHAEYLERGEEHGAEPESHRVRPYPRISAICAGRRPSSVFFVVLFCRPVQLPLKLEDGARRIWGEGDRAGELDNRRAREPESQRARGPEEEAGWTRGRPISHVHGRRHSRRFRSALGAVPMRTAARVRVEEPAPTNSVTRCDVMGVDGWTDGRMRMLRTDTPPPGGPTGQDAPRRVGCIEAVASKTLPQRGREVGP